MRDEQTTTNLIQTFLARKAEKFPELFADNDPRPTFTLRTHTRLIDIVN